MSHDDIKEQCRKLELSINLKTGDTIASSSDDATGEPIIDDFSLSIVNNLNEMFSNYGMETIVLMEKAIALNKIDETVKLLQKVENEGVLDFSSKKTKIRLSNVIRQIPLIALNPAERKKVYEIKFSLSEITGFYADLFNEIDQYLDEFGDGILPELRRCLWLIKANVASQHGKRELAYYWYCQVLSEPRDDYGTIAWAHRGLAITLGYNNPDGIYHENMAADAFLLNGDKDMYANCKAGLAENIKIDDPEKALDFLADAINVYDINNLLQKVMIAELYLNKAMIYNMCGDNRTALQEANYAIEICDAPGEFGNEAQRIAFLNAAIIFVEALERNEIKQTDVSTYQKKIIELENFMLDSEKPSYTIRIRMKNALAKKSTVELAKMKKEVMEQGNVEIEVLYWLSLFLVNLNAEFSKQLELLETAWLAAENQPKVRNDLKSIVCSLFAGMYKDNNHEDKALEWYKKALEFNPFSWTCRQNYSALLWKNEKWEDAVIFFEEQIKRFGDLPNILFCYGKSLVEAGRSTEAVTILWKARIANPSNQQITEFLGRALDQTDTCIPNNQSTIIISDTITIESFERCLNDFCAFIKNDKRMTFWKYNNEKKKHDWVSCPEKHGQNLLHSFIKSRFNDNVEVMEEVGAGAGRMDVYLRFKNGFRTIVELKMCGNRYTGGYAREGLEQLAHYLENKNTHLGYLLIFDGRKRDIGKGIDKKYSYNKFTMRSFIADVIPTIKH